LSGAGDQHWRAEERLRSGQLDPRQGEKTLHRNAHTHAHAKEEKENHEQEKLSFLRNSFDCIAASEVFGFTTKNRDAGVHAIGINRGSGTFRFDHGGSARNIGNAIRNARACRFSFDVTGRNSGYSATIAGGNPFTARRWISAIKGCSDADKKWNSAGQYSCIRDRRIRQEPIGCA
jgi:hypothetical protein